MLLNKIWLKMDQLLQLSLFMKILLPINLEFTNIPLEKLWEDTPLKSLDGELKMESNIGSSSTHGMKLGEKTDNSKLLSENAESTLKSTLD